jgi:hypothetical protein
MLLPFLWIARTLDCTRAPSRRPQHPTATALWGRSPRTNPSPVESHARPIGRPNRERRRCLLWPAATNPRVHTGHMQRASSVWAEAAVGTTPHRIASRPHTHTPHMQRQYATTWAHHPRGAFTPLVSTHAPTASGRRDDPSPSLPPARAPRVFKRRQGQGRRPPPPSPPLFICSTARLAQQFFRPYTHTHTPHILHDAMSAATACMPLVPPPPPSSSPLHGSTGQPAAITTPAERLQPGIMEAAAMTKR